VADISNYAAIVAAVAAKLTAGGAQNVYAYQRHVADWKAMLALFQYGTGGAAVIHGWTVSRERVDETWLTNKEVVRVHHFKIRGYYGCKDSSATEDTFQNLLDTVSNKWREEFDMEGTAEQRTPLQFPMIDHRLFSGVLCHYAECTVAVTERLAGGS